MAELTEKQFELEGVVFGWGCDVDVHTGGFKPGRASLRSSRTENPNGDGVRFGIDRRGSSVWSWELFTNVDTEGDAYEAMSALADVWDADEIRLTPGAVVPLRYCLAGQVRRIYGRPTRFTDTPGQTAETGRIDIVADFEAIDQVVYDDALQSVSFDFTPPADLEAGIVAPFDVPVDTDAGASTTENSILVEGTRSTPIVLIFTGPISAGCEVHIGPHTVILVDEVLDGDPITIDARPWARSVTRQSGGGARVNGRVTRIRDLWLEPGEHVITIIGSDPTGNAELTVEWRNARRSPR